MTQKITEYGSGPLFKAATTVYGVMVGDLLLVAANVLLVLAPLLVALSAGMPTASVSRSLPGYGAQLGLVFLAFVPMGPSLVAAAYAFNRLLAGEETGVFRDFVRGYRANFRQALAVWLPYLAVLAAAVVNLLLLPGTLDAGNPTQSAARVGLLGLGLLVATAAVTAMLLLSRFTFRVRDIYRLSLYSLGAQKRVSLGNAGILFVTAFLLTATTAALMLFIAGAVVYLICLNSRPMLRFIEQKFTVAGEE
ncbi:putative membrane protein YesL [Arthrobacter pascens]|uniref:YesL family protein n=1 Tax=Arthrobacter pascens TaxID=1677 RepID=UPI0027939BC2|nr:YesL family protein [Arthrobacter pascens]MDQ0679836.1 putative membrane protein YesL [Arthrobacter pascens]